MKERERLEPTPVGSSQSARGLITYYQENGESTAVAEVEAQLRDVWEPHDEILARAGRSSKGWGRNVLEYLVVQGRAERALFDLPDYIIFGKVCNWRYVWRRAQVLEGEPVLEPYDGPS